MGLLERTGVERAHYSKIIAKILRPSAGNVTTTKKLTPFLELGVGFQPNLTAAENVKIYATIMVCRREKLMIKYTVLLNSQDSRNSRTLN